MLKDYAENRRRFPRSNFKTAVAYQHKGETKIDYAITKNLSQGGLCLNLGKFIPKDSELILEFLLRNDTEPIKAKVKVSWIQRLPYSERYHAGLKFCEIDQSYKINLARFLNESLLTAA